MSGSWSNPSTSLIILIEQVSGFSGIFGYSPAPGTGNLVFSLTAAAGTDPYGNAYPAGMGFFRSGTLEDWIDSATGNIQIGSIGGAHFQFDTVNDVMNVFDSTGTNKTIVIGGSNGTIEGGTLTAGHFVITGGATPTLIFYNSSNQESVKLDANSGTGLFMDNSGLTFSYVNGGRYSFNELTSAGVEPTPTQIANGASISVGGSRMIIESGVDATNVDRNVINLFAGKDNQPTGGVFNPLVTIADFDGNSAVDLWLSGTVVKTNDGGSPFTWQAPSYNTDWSGTTSFNGLTGWGTLQFRLDAEDNVWIIGAFKAGAVAPANPVFVLPSGYRPKSAWPISILTLQGTTLFPGMAYVSTTGNLDIFTGINSPGAANNQYLINGKVPLGNIS